MSSDALAELAARFLANVQDDAARLEAAMLDQDYKTIETVAHSMAGAAGIFGFADIGAAAMAIDTCYADGGLPSETMVAALIETVRSHS